MSEAKCVGCGRVASAEDFTVHAGGSFFWACSPACSRLPPEDTAALAKTSDKTLDDLAGVLEPGQSFITGRTNEAQRAELAALEVDGAWAVTVIEQASDGEPEEVTLFCENDRAEAIKRAWFYLAGKNGKRESAQ